MNIDPRTLPMGKEKFPAGMGNCLREIESPYMRGRRLMLTYQKVEGERELSQLLIWKIVAVMGWLAFLAVVIVAGMR